MNFLVAIPIPLEEDATVRYENTNRLELQYNVYPVDSSSVSKVGMLVK